MKINTFLSSGVVSHIHLEKVTVSHLNRAGNGDYNWVFPDKEEQFEIDKTKFFQEMTMYRTPRVPQELDVQ